MKARRLVPPILRPVARRLYWRYARLHPATARGVRARAKIVVRYRAFAKSPIASLRYLLVGRELDNFTYDIANLDELATFIAEAVSSTKERARAAIDELEGDTRFRERLEELLRPRTDRERKARYGRRAGWYALVRIAKPEVVVETGIHDGLGSAILLRALERNADEGKDGRLVSVDIRPETGWLVDDALRRRWHARIGDSRVLLPQIAHETPIDMFIHDSDHSYEHEAFEFRTIVEAAREGAILVSDNVHGGKAFGDFCRQHGLRPTVFLERPRGHFYPGAGIGLAVLHQQAP